MKTILIFKSIARIIAFVILMTLSGCYSASELTKIPQNSDTLIKIDNANKSKLPSFVSSVDAKSNDAGTNTSADFERRFLGHLQKTNYFSDVLYGIYSKRPEAPYVDLSLSVNENIDLNNGANIAKAFFTGFTLFLLAPVLPATYDFDANYTLSARWPDGIQREYKASCAASAYGTWPYIGAIEKLQTSKGDATEKCLNSVINQLTSDKVR